MDQLKKDIDDANDRGPFWDPVRLLKMAIFCMICVLFACGGLFAAIGNLKEQQAGTEEVTLENRAIVCRLQKGLEMKLSPQCLTDGVTKYYDPDENASGGFRSNLKDILCFLAQQNGGHYTSFCEA